MSLLKQVLGDIIDRPQKQLKGALPDGSTKSIILICDYQPTLNSIDWKKSADKYKEIRGAFKDLLIKSDLMNFLHLLGVKSAKPLKQVVFDMETNNAVK